MEEKDMRRIFSIILSLAMLFTMPGMAQTLVTTEVKAADVSASGDFTSGNYVGQNLAFVDDSNTSAEAYTYKVSKEGKSGRLIPNNKYAYFKVENNAITQSDNDLFV